MYTFLVTLHVLGAVLLTGPFALVAFLGSRAIRRRDAGDTRRAAVLLARFALGSLLVALLGVAALTRSDRYSFRTPWVIISLTTYVIMLGVATGYTLPMMRRAARQIAHSSPDRIEAGPPDRPPAVEADRPRSEPVPATTDLLGNERVDNERLENIAGRVVGSGTLVFALVVIITILMVVRPFGR